MHCIAHLIQRVLCVGMLLLFLAGCGSGASRPDPVKSQPTPAPAEAVVEELGNRPFPPESEPELRVRILSRSIPFEPLELGTEGQRLLLLDGIDFQARVLQGPIRLSLDEKSAWRVLDSLNRSIEIPEPCTISIRTLRGDPSTIQVEGGTYPGALELVPIPAPSGQAVTVLPERIDLVTRIEIESYLPGVLDGELYGHWPADTFKAQAIAARSYAVAEKAYWRDRRHFDLVAGPASQVWNGIDCSKTARDATEATRGMVLVHDGRVVPAYYSSCCGGVPSSAVESISNRSAHEIPPLQVRLDPQPCCEAAPVRDWELSYPLSDAQRGVASFVPPDQFGDLETLEVSTRNPVGRPLEYLLRDRTGRTVTLSARSVRSLLTRLTPSGSDAPVSLKSEAMEPLVVDGTLVILGRGFGHGVGLCQYGAYERALAGDSWQEIVLRYYPEAQLVRSWD